MTTLQLTDEEARLFVLFRQHQEMMQALLSANVFQTKNGQANLHFNHQATLMQVEVHTVAFRKVK